MKTKKPTKRSEYKKAFDSKFNLSFLGKEKSKKDNRRRFHTRQLIIRMTA